jgi:hypothetical protein
VELTEKEVQTVKDLISDWGFEYSLKTNRDDLIALAERLGLHQEVKNLTI